MFPWEKAAQTSPANIEQMRGPSVTELDFVIAMQSLPAASLDFERSYPAISGLLSRVARGGEQHECSEPDYLLVLSRKDSGICRGGKFPIFSFDFFKFGPFNIRRWMT